MGDQRFVYTGEETPVTRTPPPGPDHELDCGCRFCEKADARFDAEGWVAAKKVRRAGIKRAKGYGKAWPRRKGT